MCAALVTPTRLGWWRRLRMTLRALQLRWLIRAAEDDLLVIEDVRHALPGAERHAQRRLEQLRLALSQVELGTEGLG